jgi:hypothetical protein
MAPTSGLVRSRLGNEAASRGKAGALENQVYRVGTPLAPRQSEFARPVADKLRGRRQDRICDARHVTGDRLPPAGPLFGATWAKGGSQEEGIDQLPAQPRHLHQ